MKKIILISLLFVFASCGTTYRSEIIKNYTIQTLPDTIAYNQSYDIIWGKLFKWIEFWNINILNIKKEKGTITAVLNTMRPTWAKENLCAFNISLSLKKINSENTQIINKVYVDVFDTNGVQSLPSNKLLEFCLYRFLTNNSNYFSDSVNQKDNYQSKSKRFNILGKWECQYSWHSTNLKINDFEIEFKEDSTCTLKYRNYKDEEMSFNGIWKLDNDVFSWKIEETEYRGIFDDKYMVGTMVKQNAYNGSFCGERLIQNLPK